MKKLLILLFTIGIFASSCEINQKDIKPTDSFIKIFNNPDENLSYYVESVLKLNDGYLILSGVKDASQNLNEFPTTSLIRTDEIGEVIWANEQTWRAPVGELVDLNGKIGFVGMDAGNNSYFIEVNTENGNTSGTALGTSMPLASFATSDNRLIVLSYDYVSWSSIVSVYSPDLNSIGNSSLYVGDDLVIPVQRHLNKNGTEFPFFIGEWQNETLRGVFVNCLYNYTLGVNFFDMDATNTGGWIYSHQISNGISAMLHKENDQYGITRFYNQRNYINPTVNVDVTSSQNFNDSTQNPLPELSENTRIGALKATFGANDFMLFAGTTNSNSIKIDQYTMEDDELYHSLEFNFSDKIEVKQVIQNSTDNGILILAQIYLTGRFKRPVIIKVPASDFKE